jgi:hypothetical protein
MATPNITRESLIDDLFRRMIDIEAKPQKEKDRAYVLDLLAEIANAVDGKRPAKPMKISKEALAQISRPSR